MDKETWLAERRLGVSGSDISVLMGANPYKNVDDLILDKLGRSAPFLGNEYTRAGLILEPFVANGWAQRTNVEIEQGVFTKSNVNDRYIGTPDFIGKDFGLEIKTGSERVYSKGCPKYYELQSRWYMMLMEKPVWHLVACIVPKNRGLIGLDKGDKHLTDWVALQPHREFLFVRNLDIEAQMMAKADWFLEKMDRLRSPEREPDWLRSSE